jgi:hypothetical protein
MTTGNHLHGNGKKYNLDHSCERFEFMWQSLKRLSFASVLLNGIISYTIIEMTTPLE